MIIPFIAYWCLVCWVTALFISEELSYSESKIGFVAFAPISFIIIPLHRFALFVMEMRQRYRYR